MCLIPSSNKDSTNRMNTAIQESQQDLVDICIETVSLVWYRFEHVESAVLWAALEKALADHTTFSLVNTEGACLVVPWRKIISIHSADVFEEIETEEDDDIDDVEDRRTWVMVWEGNREPDKEPQPVFQ